MNVEVSTFGNSVFIVESSTKLVICQLPGLMARTDIPALLKALSIMLKEMSNASKKHKRKRITNN